MSGNQNGNGNQESALAIMKRDAVDVVADRVREMQEAGQIQFPANYSAENAMKAAWLAIQETQDKNGKPALEVCTKNSVANSLLDMVVQALTPAKKQCYFVVYGRSLVCLRSYFGSMALVKRVVPGCDIYHAVVYEDDEFEYTLERGVKRITRHIQSLDNVNADKIKGAYSVIEDREGKIIASDIMTIDQIKQAWSQGQTYKANGNGTHQKFSDQMALKTVINRTCKTVINSSADDYLLEHVQRSDEAAAEIGMDAEAEEYANGTVIDVEPQQNAEPDPPQNETDTETSDAEQPSLAGPGF